MMKVRTKASAIIEYSILLFIVVGFLAGIHYFLKRHVQARIRAETNRYVRRPMAFLWQSSVTTTTQDTEHDRRERVGGDVVVQATTRINQDTVAVSPPPMGVPVASLHVQDAATSPPGQQNPKQKRTRAFPNRERH
ncbi:MAG: hypothetical protein JSW40_02625 [Candidatus Omnitrophota bacterium]|nr:MAG: hypothetical protein JSW40_02625 [Candidatus Omnitrophota bacterium]